MKKHTIYYVIGAVLVGTGIYLYTNKKDKSIANLTPPKEVEEEATKVPESATPPFVSAYDSIKKLLESLNLKKSTSVPTNTTV